MNVKRKKEGKWNDEEHFRFLEGMKKYGRKWDLVKEWVKTRTTAQIRSHAQKFFNKVGIGSIFVDDDIHRIWVEELKRLTNGQGGWKVKRNRKEEIKGDEDEEKEWDHI